MKTFLFNSILIKSKILSILRAIPHDVIRQMFLVNGSINHNTIAWKTKENGKWEWILVDVDRGFIKDELPYYEIEWFIN